jgi:GPH family glycoside/pentoside/hexuronide:cation symporter
VTEATANGVETAVASERPGASDPLRGESNAIAADEGIPPLTRPTLWWYGMGQFAEGVKNEAYTVFLLFYYTSVIGMSGILAGQAILIALLFDAITDPLVGSLSDRTKSRFGRRHPFLFASAIPLPVFFYLTFAPPTDSSEMQLFFWLVFCLITTRASMTLFHVPHLALGSELSTDYEERSKIVTVQNVFSRIGGGLTGGLGFLVFLRATDEFPDGRFNTEAYPQLALTLAVMIFFAVVFSAWKTMSRIPYLAKPDPLTLSGHAFGNMIRGNLEAMRMRSFRALFLGTLVVFIAFGVTTSLGLHLATYFWRVTTTEMIFWGVGMSIGMYVGYGYWLGQANATDKRSVFLKGGVLFTVFTVLPPFFLIAGFWPEWGSPLYVPLYILTTGVIAHFGIAATAVTGRSMMADVTDQDELATGRRREGIFFGATSFASKAFFGVGSLIAGLVYDFVGLEKGMTSADAPATVVRDLGLTLGLSILFLVGLSLTIFARYNLTRERCEEMQRLLVERRNES